MSRTIKNNMKVFGDKREILFIYEEFRRAGTIIADHYMIYKVCNIYVSCIKNINECILNTRVHAYLLQI